MCVYDTVENNRLRYTRECLNSLSETVDLDKHRLFIINNNSCDEATEFLIDFNNRFKSNLINSKENIGTARGINLALSQRRKNEVCVKTDDDVVWHQKNWVEELEEVFIRDHSIGICGLKRKDIWQNPNHENPVYRTTLETQDNGFILELCPDIMGTCTALNPLLLDSLGYYSQPSTYGFDDTIISARSIASGFRNCFLPHINISHIDEGGDAYCEQKKREASEYMIEASAMIDMYRTGKLDPYYDGGFDEN